MLSLRPPFLLAGNLLIFRDDKETESFYYACQQPSICIDNEGAAAVSAYAIIPESGVGVRNADILEAGLTVDVELSVTKEELAIAESEIRRCYGVSPKMLTPAPVHSGQVFFAMSNDNPEKPEGYVTSGLKPSIVGTNRASIVVRATADNAKILIASIDSGSIPACVYYELKLVGITPIYHARLKADMKLIYHRFEEMKKDNFVFYSEDISKVVDDLSDNRSLIVEVEELDPDIKAEAMRALLNELKSKVAEDFFLPADLHSDSDSDSEEQSPLGNIGSGLTSFIKDLIPGRRYTKKTIDQDSLKTITVDLSQSNAKTYPYSPQALFKTMVERAGITLSDKISWIKLDDLANKSQEVNVRVAADAFESANIKSIEVFCRVVDSQSGETIANVALPPFEPGNDLTSVFNYHRQRGINYYYEYRVNLLTDTESTKLPTLLEIPWTRVDSPYLYINPADYCKDYEIDIYLEDRTMFDQTQMVQVDVSAVISNEEAPILSRSFVFRKDDTEHRRLSIVADKNVGLKYQMRLTYYLANLKEHVIEYKDVSNTLFFVPNPFENKWSVDIRCLANWEKYERVYLSTRIKDPERSDPVTNRFIFTSQLTDQTLYAACSLDTPQETFDYFIEALPANDDKVVSSGWHQHKGGSVLILKVKDDFVSRRVIRVQLAEELDFKRWEIQYVEVTIRYADGTEESQRLLPGTQVLEFSHASGNDESQEYAYRYKLKCEGNPKSPWFKANSDNLVITIDKDLF